MADFDISEILNSLSPEDMENIKQAASSFLGGQSNTTQAQKEKSDNKNAFTDGLSSLGMPDLSQLAGLTPVLQAFNSQDERVEFINALKPLLSQERRSKADEAMKLVKLMSVLPLLRERGLM
jgi:hypothetical protein